MKINRKQIIIAAFGIILLSGIGYVGAINGWFGGGSSIPSDTMTRGLVGYWNMDEGGGLTAKDLSNNGNNGILNGEPLWVKGKNGGALKFDGNDGFVSAPSSAGDELDIISSFTLTAWVKTSKVTPSCGLYPTIITKRSSGTFESYQWNIDLSGLQYVYFDGAIRATGTSDLRDGKWHYISVTHDNVTDLTKIYNDGIEEDSNTVTTNPTSGNDALRIGGFSANCGTFDGLIDDARIYNRALSAEEVRYHYNHGGPVAEWKFDEGSGQKAFDSTENNNDGILGATSAVSTDDPTWISGKEGSALSFDGGDYVDVGANAGLNIFGGAHTMEVWAKWTNATGNALGIAGFGGFTAKAMMTTGLNNAGQDKIAYGIAASGTSTTWYYNVGSGLNDGNWHHLAVTWDGNYSHVWSFYIDGINFPAGSAGGDTIIASNRIGSGSATGSFNGSIDSVRVYNYVRSLDEIQLDYNAGLASLFGPTNKTCAEDPVSCENNGLVGYWNMDEGGASTAKDSSGNGKNGTLTNGPFWTKGKNGNALKFDGRNDYVSIGNVYNGVKSLSFWLKASNTDQSIINLNATQNIRTSLGEISIIGYWSTPIIYIDGKITSTIDTAWHYVTIIADAGINASAVDLAKVSTGYFSGVLDEVRMYNRVLSPEEINYLYNEKKPIGQWDLDEGAGTTAHDSQNNLNITFPGDSAKRPTWTKP